MALINKQRFLTELSKFLTFLTDEERGQVLMKFGEIFDAAPNQDELTSALVSPLKVTVELSRAYSKGGIEQVLERSVELSGVDLSAAPAPAPTAESDPDSIVEAIGSAVEGAFVQAPGAPADTPAAPEAAQTTPPAVSPEPASPEPPSKPVPPSEEVSEEKAVPVSEPQVRAEAPDVSENPEPQADSPASVKEASEPHPESVTPAVPVPAVPEFKDTEPEEYFDEDKHEAVPLTEYRARPVALFFFILLFVPLGLIGIAVFLCVGAALLAVAAAAVGSGVLAVSLAFSGMTIFADIIMTIGVALVCFAVGLVFLWLGVWFLIWSIGGLVRGILRLGKKWCYKEVSAQ